MKVVLNTDGNTKGANPGEGAIGFVIRSQDGTVMLQHGETIGYATNNECEYSAVIAGLHNCHLLGAREVDVYADSRLIIEQLSGNWRVKHPSIKRYHEAAVKEASRFERVDFVWIPREQNTLADRLANIALGKVKDES